MGLVWRALDCCFKPKLNLFWFSDELSFFIFSFEKSLFWIESPNIVLVKFSFSVWIVLSGLYFLTWKLLFIWFWTSSFFYVQSFNINFYEFVKINLLFNSFLFYIFFIVLLSFEKFYLICNIFPFSWSFRFSQVVFSFFWFVKFIYTIGGLFYF